MAEPRGFVRLVGGQWRNSRVKLANKDIRPTSSRIRTQLFDWLGQDLTGRQVLDLYAGSGALGLEAASRNAKHTTLIDIDYQVCRQLQQFVEKQQATNITIKCCDAQKFLQQCARQFDVIFLDPPFYRVALMELLTKLKTCVHADSQIYLEQGTPVTLPTPWQCQRSGRAGQVYYYLYRMNY